MVRQRWDETPISDTVIALLNVIVQVQHDDLEFLGHKKGPIGDFNITGVDSGET